MESYVVENSEKELDIKQLVLFIFDNIKWVILMGLLCGILLGAYGYLKTYKSDSEEIASASIQDIINKNRKKWNALDTTVTSDAFNDPLPGTYIANAKIYVDFDYSNIEGNTNLDFSAMTVRLQGDIVTLAGSNESRQKVIDDLCLHSYEDMKDLSLEDLNYLTSCGFSGANILKIQIVDTDPERALAIADGLANNLVLTASQYETVDNIRVFEHASLCYSSIYEPVGVNGYMKKTIKYFVTGCVMGVILVCGILFLFFLLNETVRTEKDLKYIDIKLFAIIPKKEEKKAKEYKRLVYDISFLENNISIIPVDDTISIDDISGNLAANNRDLCVINVTESILDNPEVVLEARKTGKTILLSTYGKTLLKNMDFAKKELEKANVDVLGAVILNAKHY